MKLAGESEPVPEISVVVPLRNEGPNILPLATAIFNALRREPRGLELILVDDGSSDACGLS